MQFNRAPPYDYGWRTYCPKKGDARVNSLLVNIFKQPWLRETRGLNGMSR